MLSDPQDWVAKHGDYLFRNAVLRIRDPTLAEEVVQDTFLAALQAKDRFAGRSSERTWLVGILKHKISDQLRKASREQPESESDFPEKAFSELFNENGHWKVQEKGPKEWVDPSRSVDQQQFWKVMKGCLGELPPRMSTAFTLREIDEMTSKEICAMLGITKSNLWVLLHRARTHLRQCLEDRYLGFSSQETL